MAAAHPVFVTFNAFSNQKKGLTPRRMSALERSKPLRGLRQREHSEDAAELGVVLQLLVAAHGAQAVGVLLEARGKADASPAADAGEHADVLLALVLPGIHVADDSRGRLELVELLADVVGIDALQVALEGAVARDASGRDERPAPDRELLGLGLHDLAGAGIPDDEVAHAAVAARRREHRERRCHERLARGVLDLERLVVHAHVVGRHVEHLVRRVVRRRLLVLAAECRGADPLGVDVCTLRLRAVLGYDLRTAGLHVDVRRPVHLRIVLRRDEQLTGGAIQRVAEAVAIEMHHDVVRLAFHADAVGEDHLVCRLLLEKKKTFSRSSDEYPYFAINASRRPTPTVDPAEVQTSAMIDYAYHAA